MKKILTLALSLCLALGVLTGCGGTDIAFTDNVAEDGSYNSELYYTNEHEIFGADPSVIYVDKSQSAEYGGYFYLYVTPRGASGYSFENSGGYSIMCMRSRDGSDWEKCGAYQGGYCFGFEKEEWPASSFWAPEAIYNPTDGYFYLFMTNRAKANTGNVHLPQMTDEWSKFCFSVARSETPLGPFTLLTSDEYYKDKNVQSWQKTADGHIANLNGDVIDGTAPLFNFTEKYGYKTIENVVITKSMWDVGCIDASPFIDPTTGELYLYFVYERNEGNAAVLDNVSWVIKMKDWISPDFYGYEDEKTGEWVYTCRPVAIPEYESTRFDEEKFLSLGGLDLTNKSLSSYTKEEIAAAREKAYASGLYMTPNLDENGNPQKGAGWTNTGVWYGVDANGVKQTTSALGDSKINEGPFCMYYTDPEHNVSKYYLSHTNKGNGARNYDARVAVADSPLGPFNKLDADHAIMCPNDSIDYGIGLGHQGYAQAGGEWWAFYGTFGDSEMGYDSDRCLMVDRMVWIYDEELGFATPRGNGPTMAINPKPYVATGYKNIAAPEYIKEIKVSGKHDKDTVKYLNDGWIPCYDTYADRQFKADGKVTITVKFNEPMTVRSVLVYNSYEYNTAFAKIDKVEYKLAEHPAWLKKNADTVITQNIKFNPAYYSESEEFMRLCSPCVSETNEMKVGEIRITVSENLVEYDSEGNKNGTIQIADLFIMGR